MKYHIIPPSPSPLIITLRYMDTHDLVEFGKEFAENSELKFKHASLIVSGNGAGRHIVAKGVNRYIMDLLNHNHSIHSEVAALEDFINNHVSQRIPRQKRIAMAKNIMKKNNYDMFVIRTGKHNGGLGYSKPCAKCQKYLADWPIRQIYYTT
jgi:hypothetical protein